MDEKEAERIFLSFLGTGEKLKWQLDNNINLLGSLKQNKPNLFFLLKCVPSFCSKEQERQIKKINTKGILNLFQKERPDLYEKITKHPNGIKWLERQLENFKKVFLRG